MFGPAPYTDDSKPIIHEFKLLNEVRLLSCINLCSNRQSPQALRVCSPSDGKCFTGIQISWSSGHVENNRVFLLNVELPNILNQCFCPFTVKHSWQVDQSQINVVLSKHFKMNRGLNYLLKADRHVVWLFFDLGRNLGQIINWLQIFFLFHFRPDCEVLA